MDPSSMPSALTQLLSKLPDPDAIGSSEYRAIHEVLESIDCDNGDDAHSCAISILDEFTDSIADIRRLLTA
ncbi:MAG: hypothetical protein EOP85_02880 [Verrucomicrobiaceae bacterium]|nr:MAG: hypothetical protein EOP85_02880 [Verrucomicrobiaceae bacterium]